MTKHPVGTHYTLSRALANPMEVIKEKACRTCNVVKPNTFDHFGKKLWRTRHELTTNDVCMACQRAKVSATMRQRWQERRMSEEAYEAERRRMALAVLETQERLKVLEAQRPSSDARLAHPMSVAPRPLTLVLEESTEIKPLTLSQAFEDEIVKVRDADDTATEAAPADEAAKTDDSKAVESTGADEGIVMEPAKDLPDHERLIRELLGHK